jgi:hypothetical protein
MGEVFYGTIRQVDGEVDLVAIKCVRSYFFPDGLLSDDVWVWTVSRPEASAIERVRAAVGRAVDYFDVIESDSRSLFIISLDDDGGEISVPCAGVVRKEEARSRADLEEVVIQLSQRLTQGEAEYLDLCRRLSSVATFVEQKIDRIQRRAAFLQERDVRRAEGLSRESEDLKTILRRIKTAQPGATDNPGDAQ